jgi:hypothetical protein
VGVPAREAVPALREVLASTTDLHLRYAVIAALVRLGADQPEGQS